MFLLQKICTKSDNVIHYLSNIVTCGFFYTMAKTKNVHGNLLKLLNNH